MANPPFDQDITNPADNGIVSQFPANERTFRDNVNSYLGTEHDTTTGYHKFQLIDTATKTGLTSPPAGMLVYDTDLGFLQINTGTSSVPVWTTLAGLPTGAIVCHGASTAPTGFLACDGAAVSRTTYAALFAIIGTTFGTGDGSTTFNVPSFNRRSPVGSGGTGTSTLASTIGSTGGEETHTLTAAESATLTYTASSSDSGHTHGYTNANGGDSPFIKNAGTPFNFGTNSAVTSSGSANITTTVSSNAGGGAHNTYHPALVVKFIIKT